MLSFGSWHVVPIKDIINSWQRVRSSHGAVPARNHFIHYLLELALHLLSLPSQVLISYLGLAALILENTLNVRYRAPVRSARGRVKDGGSISGLSDIKAHRSVNMLSLGVEQVHLPWLHFAWRFSRAWVHHIHRLIDVQLTSDRPVDLRVESIVVASASSPW